MSQNYFFSEDLPSDASKEDDSSPLDCPDPLTETVPPFEKEANHIEVASSTLILSDPQELFSWPTSSISRGPVSGSISAPSSPSIIFTNYNDKSSGPSYSQIGPLLFATPSRSSLETVRAVRRIKVRRSYDGNETSPTLPDEDQPTKPLKSSRSVDQLTPRKRQTFVQSLRRRLTSILKPSGKAKSNLVAASDKGHPANQSTSLGVEYIAVAPLRRVRSFASPDNVRTPKIFKRQIDGLDEATVEASLTARDLSARWRYAPIDGGDNE